MPSVRITTKIAVWCAALASIALAVCSAAMFGSYERARTASLDAALRDEVGGFFETYFRRERRLSWITQREVEESIFGARDPRKFFEVIGPDGQILAKSKSLRGYSLGKLDSGHSWSTIGERKVRAYSRSEDSLMVNVASEVPKNEFEKNALVWTMIYSLPVVAICVGFAAWLISRRALKPLRGMAEVLDGISPQRINNRLPGARSGDEVGRLSRAFNGALDRLEGNLKQVNRFSGDASHELKTPISVIKGGLGELMHSRNLSENDLEAVVELLEQVGRVTAIMDSLLLLSRVDAGHLTISIKPVDVSQMVRELVEDFDMLGAVASVKLQVNIDQPVWVKADESMLRQVLVNLLENATKYNFPDGSVRLEIESNESESVIRVANTGPGIPQEHRARVFERFFRVEHTSEIRGTGLGLCLSREIARALGGELSLADPRDGWTEFILSLPTSPAIAPKESAK